MTPSFLSIEDLASRNKTMESSRHVLLCFILIPVISNILRNAYEQNVTRLNDVIAARV